MIRTVSPGERGGGVRVPASKSQMHRLLICAALSENGAVIEYGEAPSKDVIATAKCLSALGADMTFTDGFISVKPVSLSGDTAHMSCGESGSTLRFLLPVAGALGKSAVFRMEGRLPERPMDPLTKALEKNGMKIERSGNDLFCSGKLTPGDYVIPGNVSSQFISGLLMALPLTGGDSTVTVTGTAESAQYVKMTEEALARCGAAVEKKGETYFIKGTGRFNCPEKLVPERDWSSAAFFLVAGAFSEKGISVFGMDPHSSQGDKAIAGILGDFGANVEVTESAVTVRKGELCAKNVCASGIPDLVPVISVLAAASRGVTVINGAERLRYKESDRLRAVSKMLSDLGGEVSEKKDGLVITGKGRLKGGAVDPFNDHRIAMSAAIAAGLCEKEVVIQNAECTDKSYPSFWNDLEDLEVKK